MPEICRFLGIVTTMFYDDHVTGTCPKNSVSDCIRTGSGSDWVTADKRTPVISMKSLPNLTRSLPLPVLIALRALTDLFFVQALRLVFVVVSITQGRIVNKLGVGSAKKAAGANRATGVVHGESHCCKVC
jgi:hypothetical protein